MTDTVTRQREEVRLLRDVMSWGSGPSPVSEADAMERRDTLRGALAALDAFYAKAAP